MSENIFWIICDTIVGILDFLVWYYGGSSFYLIGSLLLFTLAAITLTMEVDRRKKEKRDN